MLTRAMGITGRSTACAWWSFTMVDWQHYATPRATSLRRSSWLREVCRPFTTRIDHVSGSFPRPRGGLWQMTGTLPAAAAWEVSGTTQPIAPSITWAKVSCMSWPVCGWLKAGDEADSIAGRWWLPQRAEGQRAKASRTWCFKRWHVTAPAGWILLLKPGAALVLGEPEGYLRTFLDEGDQLVDLLQRLTRQKSKTSTYARLLLSKLETPPWRNGSMPLRSSPDAAGRAAHRS